MDKKESIKKINLYDLPFSLLLIFLFFDYGRPQSFSPIISALHLGWFLQPLLFLCLLFKGKIFNLKNIQTKCFLGLILLMTLHVPIAVNNYWAYHTWRSSALYFIVYLSIVNFVDSFPKIEKYIDIWIIINLICAIVGIKNGGKVPNSAFMGDENDFALVMNMVIPFAYFMFLETKSSRKKIFYLFAMGLFIAANVASLSRGGFVGLIPVIAYCLYKTPRKISAIICVVITVGVLSLFATEKYWDEMRSIKEENVEKGTGGERWYSWKIGWRMFLDHPIIGVGPENYAFRVGPYEPPGGLHGRSRAGRAAHSLYFTLIPELGLIGIFLFSAMLYYNQKDNKWILNFEKRLKYISKKKSKEPMTDQIIFSNELDKLKLIIFAINGSLLGYLISGIFLSVLYYPHFWILIGISVAIKNTVQKRIEEIHLQDVTAKY